MAKPITFTAAIQAGNGGGAYCDVPFDVETTFAGQVPDPKRPSVLATIEGETFNTRLMKMGRPCHFVHVPKDVRTKLNKAIGDEIKISLVADNTPREIEIPTDLAKLLAKDKPAKTFFDSLSYTHRKEYVRWITEAKKEETRQSRLAKIIPLLHEGKRGI